MIMKNWFKKESKMIYLLNVFMDILLVFLGIWTAISFAESNFYVELIPFVGSVTLIFFHVYGVFNSGKKSYSEIIFSILLALVFINISSMILTFFHRELILFRNFFLLAFVFQSMYLMIWKLLFHKIHTLFSKPDTVLLFGFEKKEMSLMAEKVSLNNNSAFVIRYVCEELNAVTCKLIEKVDAVIICANINNFNKEKIVSYCMERDKTIYVIPELFEISLFNAKMTQFDDMPAFCIKNFHLSIEQRFLKRAFDIIMSLMFILISSPILLISYFSIKLYDGGTVIYTQERVTRWNKKFKVYKFRTMIEDAEKKTGPVLATDQDSRVTPIGAFMRATRIDELPQFFNVLMGDMSIVGPRPERQHFIEEYKEDIPDFDYRLVVKAGITGLAQVLGKYTTTPKDKLRYDLFYIRNYSFLIDIKIILQTVKIMFMKVTSQGVKTEKFANEIKSKYVEVISKDVS